MLKIKVVVKIMCVFNSIYFLSESPINIAITALSQENNETLRAVVR